ncbi:TolC family protein [Amnimonas aquatica]|nr:TolC family protein [Amnimonas aquatica]
MRLLPAGIVLVLAGCASLPADRGLANVNELVKARDPGLAAKPTSMRAQDKDLNQQVDTLLAQPLTAERAVGVALLRNPRVRLEYARLGLNQADWVEASRLSNPVLSFSAMNSNVSGDATKLGYGLAQNFTDLLFIRSRSRLAKAELIRLQAETALSLQELAADVNEAYFEAVGSAQIAQMRTVIAKATRTSADLAKRFHDAGNINALELAREQAAAEQAELDQEAAQAEAESARVTLNTLIGLATNKSWQLDARLPLPVSDESSAQELIDLGLKQRLDLVAERMRVERSDDVLGLAKTLRWIPFLEVGIAGERDSDRSRSLGPTVALELPLFGKSGSGVLRAEALQEQSRANVALLEGEVANGISKAYARMVSARTRVLRHQRGLIPQREAIVARTQELQNYMIVGQFELLLAKREEYNAYEGYLAALRDYWKSRVDLARAVGGALPSDTHIGELSISPIMLPEAASAGTGHAGHNMPAMEGMDHSQDGASAPLNQPAMTSHDMSNMGEMSGMDHSGMTGMEATDSTVTPAPEAAPTTSPHQGH